MTPMNSWLEFKQYLAKSSPWLNEFMEPLDVRARPQVHGAPVRNDYETFLIEHNLRHMTAALERCKLLRRQGAELELEATQSAADFQLKLELWQAEQDLEANALNERRMFAEMTRFEQAANTFGNANPGFALLSLGLSKSAAAGLEGARERRGLLAKRWQTLAAFHSTGRTRHLTEENADNYAERWGRLVGDYARGLAEAHNRCRAITLGFNQVYGESRLVTPYLSDPQLLDTLCTFAAHVTDLLEMEGNLETPLDLVVPLTQPWRPGQRVLVSAEDLKENLSSNQELHIVSFHIHDLVRNARARLQSVGLSYIAKAPPAGGPPRADTDLKLRATVHLPPQADPRRPGQTRDRPPIALGAIPAAGGRIPADVVSGPACHNANPRGEWRLVFSGAGPLVDVVEDIRLHLGIAAMPLRRVDTVF